MGRTPNKPICVHWTLLSYQGAKAKRIDSAVQDQMVANHSTRDTQDEHGYRIPEPMRLPGQPRCAGLGSVARKTATTS
jgi:hypothetical protein